MKAKVISLDNHSSTTFIREQQKNLMMYAPNDIISNKFFNLDEDFYKRGAFLLQEKQGERYEDLTTTIKLKFANNPVNFNFFHRILLNVCISAYVEGNFSLSLDEFYRRLVGNVYNPHSELPKIRKQVPPVLKPKILQALKDLLSTKISIDMTKVCTKWKKYNDRKPFIISNNPILPGRIIEGSSNNGKSAIRIELTGESPFYTIAAMKKQILAFPLYLLDVPINATENTLKIRHSLMMRLQRRIQQGLNSNIILENFFGELDIELKTKDMRYKCLKSIEKMFKHWSTLKIAEFDGLELTKIHNFKHIDILKIDVKSSKKTARKRHRHGQEEAT